MSDHQLNNARVRCGDLRMIKTMLLVSMCLLQLSCSNENMNQDNKECIVESPVKSKAIAQSKIIGKWNWLKTTYMQRGAGTNTETPVTRKKSIVYDFQDNKVLVYEDAVVKDEFMYEIKFRGEGTNTVDEQLVIIFTHSVDNADQGTSLLFLDDSGKCMTLGNSYNDAGGDLNFSRVD